MVRKPVAIVIAVVGGFAASAAAVAATGGFSPDTMYQPEASSPSSPTATPSQAPSAAAEPRESPSALPSPSAEPVSTNAPDAEPAPAPEPKPEPAPAAKTSFRNMTGYTLQAGSETGVLPTYIEGEVKLADGATVTCVTVMGGQTWPMDAYVGEGWIGDHHPLSVFGNVHLDPADYPWTMTCTSSDGASWTGSGTATEDEFIGY